MPKVPISALIWSCEHGQYELHPADPFLSFVVPGEEEAWFAWLRTHASFSFQGQAGRLNVHKEARPRGEGYWYSYHAQQGQTHKRYLGHTPVLTLTRLEEIAQALCTGPAEARTRGSAKQANCPCACDPL